MGGSSGWLLGVEDSFLLDIQQENGIVVLYMQGIHSSNNLNDFGRGPHTLDVAAALADTLISAM